MSGTEPTGPKGPDAQGPVHADVRVVAGRPTDEEVAAIVIVLTALTAGHGPERAPGRADGDGRGSAWADPARRLLGPGAPGSGWRASGLPR
ncbi:acyl-CoA carboxylase subunit epsilon [Terracoccus luteus]|uniref:Acyl-CoA carboxylase epsilon subunit-like protein n=1 Tax=Terracoccus luteus TaxID=53356 RepID=A0A839PMG1_9MICO|nr:acyl-CoA carboxylase subunit epsilon [Terracoccus luteus]MBB2985488.1 hypothetical protein [Terracoccus luteus]MCP2171140.1 hypothetical protein [Terracoccus luteus]